MELTQGVGADSVLECVGTQESMVQAIRSARPGGSVSYVGIPHASHARRRGAVLHDTSTCTAVLRQYVAIFPNSFGSCRTAGINPGKVFDLELPLEQVAEGLSSDGRTPRNQDAASHVALAVYRKESCVMSRSSEIRHRPLSAIALPITTSSRSDWQPAPHRPRPSDRDRFVGAWRLAWMEEPGPDGKIIRRRIGRAR